MLTRTLALLLFLIPAAAISQTSASGYTQSHPKATAKPEPNTNSCPWLTEGSAAKALGGDVSVTVKVANAGEGSCKFARQQDAPNSLEILVSKASLSSCPTGSIRLTGVGNEASECKLQSPHGEASEMVSSRVRDMNFTVTLAEQEHRSHTKSMDERDDVAAQIAEQVAGNLY